MSSNTQAKPQYTGNGLFNEDQHVTLGVAAVAAVSTPTNDLVAFILSADERGVLPLDEPIMLACVQEVVRRGEAETEENGEAGYWLEHFNAWWPSAGHAYWDCGFCGWVHHPLDAHQ